MAVSKDDKLLSVATGEEQGTVHLFDLVNRVSVCSIRSVGGKILDIDMEDSQTVVFVTEKTVSVYTREGKVIHNYKYPEDTGKPLNIRKRENKVMVTTRKGWFLVYDILSNEKPSQYKIEGISEDLEVASIRYDQNFTHALLGSVNGEVSCIDIIITYL